MPTDETRRVRDLLALHHSDRGFVLPNAWDAASAILLVQAGFRAVATTSAGIAFSLGKQDYRVTDPALAVGRDEMFARIRQIVAAVGAPVSADLEAGWGDEPEAVAETVRIGLASGLAGGNIEDRSQHTETLLDEDLAVERIAAAAQTIERSGEGFVLNARTDLLQVGADIDSCIRRSNRFLQAGAACVFTPGARDLETIRLLAREIAGPLNVVVGLGSAPADIPAILDAGVKRITLGGAIARATLAFVRRCARELHDEARADFAVEQLDGAELNAIFARAHSDASAAV